MGNVLSVPVGCKKFLHPAGIFLFVAYIIIEAWLNAGIKAFYDSWEGTGKDDHP
jgi:hypothetical protein